MPKFKDLTGQTIGEWTVIERAEDSETRHVRWLCECSCGNRQLVYRQSLRSGGSTNCGCLNKSNPKNPTALIDLTGLTFGRWTVIDRYEDKGKAQRWKCVCACGTEKLVNGNHLKRGNTQSCGCLATERRIGNQHGRTHNLSHLPEYQSWLRAKSRCNNPKNPSYARYGERGIRVCERWLESFENFYEDVGPKPSDIHSIDRIDSNGNYEPGNVRWATPTEQSRNLSSNRRITHQGMTLCITEWAEFAGIPSSAMYGRVNSGWSMEKAISAPLRDW